MAQNPFYVEPLGGVDIGAGLTGIGAILQERRQKEEAQGAADAAKEEVQAAVESGDTSEIARVSIKYPQMRQVIESAMNITEEGQRRDSKQFYEAVLTNPEGARETSVQRLQMLQETGRDPTQTMGFINELDQDYEGSMKNVEALYAMQFPESYNAFIKTRGDGETTAFQTLKERAEAAGLEAGTPEFQEFMRHGGAAPATGGLADQRARKIDEYQKLFGMSVEDATTAVDSQTMMDDKGNLISFDPISGQGTLVDVDTGTERPVIQPPEGVAIEDLAFDPSQGTGFGASFLGLWNATLGQLPLAPVAKETEVAAQNLRVLERDAIRALASSGRPPVIEQQRIAALIPEAMSFTQNPEIAKYKMTNFVDLMMNQYIDDKRYKDDPSNPKSVREDSARRSQEIESIVRRVLTPQAADSMFQSLNKVEAEIGEVRTMTIDALTDIDPASLTAAQRDIYIKRLLEEDE